MTAANYTSILKGATWRDARWMPAPHNWSGFAAAVIVRIKALAPYALIELLLPGGSVMALLLWLYRRRNKGVGFGRFPVRQLSFLRLADPLRSNAAVRSAVGSITASSAHQSRLQSSATTAVSALPYFNNHSATQSRPENQPA
jgi:hypothetical protein